MIIKNVFYWFFFSASFRWNFVLIDFIMNFIYFNFYAISNT